MEREFYTIKDENGKEKTWAINSQEEKDDFFNNARTNNKQVFDQSGNTIDLNIPKPGKSQGADQPQNNQQKNMESSSENTSSDLQLNNTDSKIEKSSENVVEIGDASKGNKTSMLGFLKKEIEKDNIRVEEAESELQNIPEITEPIKNETELAEKLTNQYIEFGFEFAEANYLGQTVKMISPDGKNSIKIHLNKLDKSQKLIKDFFKKHYDPNAEDITPTKKSVENQVEKTRKESEEKTKTDIDVLASNFNPDQEKTNKENLLNQIKNKKYYTYNPSGETKEERVNEFNAYDAVPSHIEEYRKHKVEEKGFKGNIFAEFYDPNFDTSMSDDDIIMSPDFMKFVKKKHGVQGSMVVERMGLNEIKKYNDSRKTQKDIEAVRLVSKQQFAKFLSEKNPPEKFDEQLWNRGLQGEGGYFKNPEYLKIENENKKRIGEYLSKYNQIQQNPNYSEEERLVLQNELKSEYDLLANSLHDNILQGNKVENITKQKTEENRNLTKATKKYLEEKNLELGIELSKEEEEKFIERENIEKILIPQHNEIIKIKNDLNSTQNNINKLNKKYNINFKEDEEGNKIYDLDYINEGIEKINKKYENLPKTEKELKALLDKKVDEVKAKYDLTDKKQVDKANKEVTDYQQGIQDQLNAANEEIITYRENELDKIRQYEKEKDLIISKHNDNLKLHKEKLNDYLSYQKKYDEVNAELGNFQDTKLVLDLSTAENRKRLSAFGDGEWWNIKSKEIFGGFAGSFLQAASAIYDVGDRFTDNLVDYFITDKDDAKFVKELKAHLIPLGTYFDSDSRLAPVDEKNRIKNKHV